MDVGTVISQLLCRFYKELTWDNGDLVPDFPH